MGVYLAYYRASPLTDDLAQTKSARTLLIVGTTGIGFLILLCAATGKHEWSRRNGIALIFGWLFRPLGFHTIRLIAALWSLSNPACLPSRAICPMKGRELERGFKHCRAEPWKQGSGLLFSNCTFPRAVRLNERKPPTRDQRIT